MGHLPKKPISLSVPLRTCWRNSQGERESVGTLKIVLKWEPSFSDCYRGGNSPRSCTFDSGVCRNQKAQKLWTWWNIETWFTLHLWPRINPKKYATLVRNYFFIYFSPMMMAGANCYIVGGSSRGGWPPVTIPVDQATNLADQGKKKKIKKALQIHIRYLAFCQIHWPTKKEGENILPESTGPVICRRFYFIFNNKTVCLAGNGRPSLNRLKQTITTP